MIDRLSLVSYRPLRLSRGRSPASPPEAGGRAPGCLYKGTDWGLPDGTIYLEAGSVRVGTATRTYWRADLNPNRVFGGADYGYRELADLVRNLYGVSPGVVDVLPTVGGKRGEPVPAVRVTRVDLNADVRGSLDRWSLRVDRARSRRVALYVESGELNGIYVGKNPLLRVYRKSEKWVRVEYQARPRCMCSSRLKQFFEDGFRLSEYSGCRFLSARLQGDGLTSRLFRHLATASGVAFARKAVGRPDRWRLETVDHPEMLAEVDAAYWQSYQPSDDVTKFEAMKEGLEYERGQE